MIIKPIIPIPQIKKYKEGKTPSTIQKMMGKITKPGERTKAKIAPIKPSQELIARNQNMNVKIPDPIHNM